jgi:excinuclease ABC subunit C
MVDLKSIPYNPGVYIMKNEKGVIIYIGKAKNLKKRVTSYFIKEHESVKTKFLVEKIDTIDFIITNSEKDALILENQLIKTHLPHYNINLKDGKSYLQLAIDYNHRYPIIYTTREKHRKKVRYFGPYPSAINARALSLIAEKYFFLRRCKVSMPFNTPIPPHRKPCTLYYLNKCYGACIEKESEKEYKKRLKQFITLLNGNFKKIQTQLKQDMHHYSDTLQFEQAAKMRDLLSSLEEIVKEQKIYFDSDEIIDLFGHYEQENNHTFVLLRFIKGQLLFKRVLNASSKEPLEIIFDNVVEKIYINDILDEQERLKDISFIEKDLLQIESEEQEVAIIPHTIVLPDHFPLVFEEKLSFIFDHFYKKKVSFKAIFKGEFLLKSLHQMAMENALAEWKSYYKITQNEFAIKDLKEILLLPKDPLRIETYDISNIGDHFAVGSCVSFYNGVADKKHYRHFKMKYTQSQNDFAMIQETLLRRFKLKNMPTPDLLVIDGGRGQVSAAKELLDAMGVKVPFVGLSKKEELLILPNSLEPIRLSHEHPGLKIIMASRDEAHRFANSLRSKLLRRKTLQSNFNNIKGLSLKRKELLLKEFGSFEKMRQLSVQEIYEKTKIPLTLIEKILDFLKTP